MDLQLTGASAWELFCKVKETGPLIQCITNFVSMDIMANMLLAAGASPAMAHSREEAAEFVRLASAVLINVGTLSPEWTDSMRATATAARELGKPWVLDPVGAGATTFRTQTILSLVDLKPTLIRGNASEVMAVAGGVGTVRGVDSTASAVEALSLGKDLARRVGCVVAISGATDLVTDGHRVVACRNGTPLLTKVTATGCAVTALAAAFIACAPHDPLTATAHALAVFGLAAELAAREARGPASLRVGLLDALYSVKQSQVCENVLLNEANDT
ncbi:hypothetical protein WJX81_003512 [Elliptochloris bilobata]|uniref:hydroxyethylthiazole kinase n=1 Tax=Elliptochloris bilobata TaxID=381761 RepID=A0AAW1S9E2_9CHLO